MSQSQTNLSKIENDLVKTEDIVFEKYIILLILLPIYVIGNEDIEKNLSTGNDDLDQIVNHRLIQCCQCIKELIQKNMNFNVIVCEIQNNKFYLTIEKLQKNVFSTEDCITIRKLFDEYNTSQQTITIIKESEAFNSLFFDELGDIKLGFQIESIDYI